MNLREIKKSLDRIKSKENNCFNCGTLIKDDPINGNVVIKIGNEDHYICEEILCLHALWRKIYNHGLKNET